MQEFSIKYSNEGPNRIYEVQGRVTITQLQSLEQQIRGNEKNVCYQGRGLYSFDVMVTFPDDNIMLMILNQGSEYVKTSNFILRLKNYDPNN